MGRSPPKNNKRKVETLIQKEFVSKHYSRQLSGNPNLTQHRVWMLVCGAWAGFRPSPVGTTVTANRRLHLQASWLSPDKICPQHLFFGQGQPKSPSKLCVFDLVAWLWSLKRHDAVCLARPMWNLMRAILGSSSTNGLKNAMIF